LNELIIRPFSASDSPAALTIIKAAVPEVPISEERLRNNNAKRNPIIRFQRWVVVSNGDLVAYGGYDQLGQSSHPREFHIYGAVHPNYQFKGVGSALYDHIIVALRQFDALLIQAYVLENKNRSIEFLKVRGFQEAQQDQQESLLFLDITSFDPLSNAEIEENLQSRGIMIKTLKELQAEANFDHKLYELYHELIQQTPSSQPLWQKSYDEFIKELKRTDLLPEAYNIALHEGKYVGMNVLYTTEPEQLFNEFTGVKLDYRRLGIAKGLKLRGIAYAKAHNYSTIITRINLRNEPIVQLNRQLGFIALIKFVKVFR
jgi:mycothiol synthase